MRQALELSDRVFKITVINMWKFLRQKVDNIKKQIGIIIKKKEI